MNRSLLCCIVLMILSIMAVVSTQDELEDPCLLYGGKCTKTCPKNAQMGNGQTLCSGRNSICCNKHAQKCKNRGGECLPPSECPQRIQHTSADCQEFGRVCCIWL